MCDCLTCTISREFDKPRWDKKKILRLYDVILDRWAGDQMTERHYHDLVESAYEAGWGSAEWRAEACLALKERDGTPERDAEINAALDVGDPTWRERSPLSERVKAA